MHLVTRGHFQSRDKDGGHTNRSAIVENSMLDANVMALCFVEPGVIAYQFYIAGMFDLFGFCDLELDRSR